MERSFYCFLVIFFFRQRSLLSLQLFLLLLFIITTSNYTQPIWIKSIFQPSLHVSLLVCHPSVSSPRNCLCSGHVLEPAYVFMAVVQRQSWLKGSRFDSRLYFHVTDAECHHGLCQRQSSCISTIWFCPIDCNVSWVEFNCDHLQIQHSMQRPNRFLGMQLKGFFSVIHISRCRPDADSDPERLWSQRRRPTEQVSINQNGHVPPQSRHLQRLPVAPPSDLKPRQSLQQQLQN